MNPLTSKRLKGTWSTLLLPLNETEDIQWDGIDDQLNALAKAEVDGIYFNGTACEFYSQSNEEFLRLARTTQPSANAKAYPFKSGPPTPTQPNPFEESSKPANSIRAPSR